MTFGFVPAPYGPLWGAVRKLLDDAVRRGKNEWPDVIAALMTGRAQLWLTVTDRPINATVTLLDGDTLEVWLCGGEVLSGALPYLETIIEAAKADGVTRGRIIGRRGWDRVLSAYGWRREGDELVKDFD